MIWESIWFLFLAHWYDGMPPTQRSWSHICRLKGMSSGLIFLAPSFSWRLRRFTTPVQRVPSRRHIFEWLLVSFKKMCDSLFICQAIWEPPHMGAKIQLLSSLCCLGCRDAMACGEQDYLDYAWPWGSLLTQQLVLSGFVGLYWLNLAKSLNVVTLWNELCCRVPIPMALGALLQLSATSACSHQIMGGAMCHTDFRINKMLQSLCLYQCTVWPSFPSNMRGGKHGAAALERSSGEMWLCGCRCEVRSRYGEELATCTDPNTEYNIPQNRAKILCNRKHKHNRAITHVTYHFSSLTLCYQK